LGEHAGAATPAVARRIPKGKQPLYNCHAYRFPGSSQFRKVEGSFPQQLPGSLALSPSYIPSGQEQPCRPKPPWKKNHLRLAQRAGWRVLI
jgi:hypothetical protein